MEPGTRLDQYRIVDKLGEGGMGAVYRAEDTRLKRQVAIKVLPPELAADEERLARLDREAQLLAALNHPNVATVHGLGDAEVADETGTRRVRFLVMELVEGVNLHDRLAEGPLPVPEAIDMATKVAAGLEAAHERGIVHRDLKPANVQLCPDGNVKVLDFGLAKAYEGDAASGALELSASPTVAAATRTGMILGTAAYMSPEQARGRAVDRRADIWAFGCVLYEALTGRKAFDGETVSDVLAAILKEEPRLDLLPATAPARLRHVLERCLEKQPAKRMQHMGDARLELEAARTEPPVPSVAPGTGIGWRVAAPAGVLLLVGGALAGWLLGLGSTAPVRPLDVLLSDEVKPAGTEAVALSPDARTVALAEAERIRTRRLAQNAWADIPVSAAPGALLFSADGERLYYTVGGEIWRTGLGGAPPQLLADTPAQQYLGGWRGTNEEIFLFGFDAGSEPASVLRRVDPVRGGVDEVWRHGVEGNGVLLPAQPIDAETYLGWQVNQNGDTQIGLLRRDEGKIGRWLADYRRPRLAPDGRIVAVDARGRLLALALAADGESISDAAAPIADGLMVDGLFAYYDVAADGSVAFVAGATSGAAVGTRLVWFGAEGEPTVISERTGVHQSDSRLSPDGRFLAIEGQDDGESAVWIHDIERDTRTPLAAGALGAFPVWSPDGERVAFERLADEGATDGIDVAPVDHSTPPARLLDAPEGEYLLPMDWSPDGSKLLYLRSPDRYRNGGADIWELPLDAGEPVEFLATPANETDPRYSPDGRWIAYMSDYSGQRELYLRPASGGGEIPVSRDGAADPEWLAGSSTLFFRQGAQVLAVDVDEDGTLSPLRPAATLPARSNGLFIVAPNGQLFATAVAGSVDDTGAKLRAIFNPPAFSGPSR